MESPSPHAEFFVSWLAPGVSPPSPSSAKTLTSCRPAIFSANAWPAAGGIPWPDGPVFHLSSSVLPAISAWPGSPPWCRSRGRSSQVSANSPS